MGGIVCGDTYFFLQQNTYDFFGNTASLSNSILLEIIAGYFIVCIISHFLSVYYRLHYLFGVFILSFCFVSGMLLTTLRLYQTDFDYSNKIPSVYKVLISGKPMPKQKTILCHAIIEGKYQNNKFERYRDKKFFLLYFAKDSALYSLKRGDELLVYTHLSPPLNKGNPDEFDYRRYLIRNGVSGTGYIASEHWRQVGYESSRTLFQLAQDYRDKVIDIFRNLGFRGDNYAVLSALTVGYMDELSNEIKEIYSVAGVSHVLSLSGLHIGILYALLIFLFSPFWKKWNALKPWIYAIIVILLWAFAFFTGAQPPVIRSVIMATVYAFSCLQSNKPLSLNTLAATAFFMLLYNPLWFYDVGFQLSFSSIAAIILLQPKIYGILIAERKPATSFLSYIKGKINKDESVNNYHWINSFFYMLWGIISVSIAAQIGTAPLIAHYFHQLPTHFLITNLWIIPATTLALYLALFMLLMTPFPTFQQLIADLLNKLLDLQNEILRATANWPFASVNQLWVDAFEVGMLYLILLMIYRSIKLRTSRSVYCMLFCLLSFSAYQLYDRISNIPSKSIVFYNDTRKNLNVHCFAANGDSWLLCTGPSQPYFSLYKSVSPYWAHLHLSTPHFLLSNIALNELSVHDGIVNYGGKHICLLYDNHWLNRKCRSPLTIDYLYVSNGYKGKIRELTAFFHICEVILNSSFSDFRRESIEKECKRMEIPYFDLSKHGALIVYL